MMFNKSINIRCAIIEDIPFLREMIWQALLASPTFLAQYGVEKVQQAEERYWGGWMGKGDPAFVAVDADGEKLGAITLKPNDADEVVGGWRIGIGVEARVRGQGVGQLLIERAIGFAREEGVGYVNLLVDPTNVRAIALYERMGFVRVGEEGEMIEMRIDLQ